ncbi:MAG: DNA polymerase III subunit epsilon [Proteobacteria bacterium]|nr:DNA polymerase III subunit epsilon [Pseudomonadota bacterium]MDA1328362.1 DNA polymerase III subunit epsilon [Pseudomonadota bacterium]
MRQVVLDTETTGLSAQDGDRILEIGCVELVQRRPTGHHLHLYINPERDSHPDALKVHGITSEFLSDKPKFADVAETLLAYLAGAEIIIHNAPFDVGFLDRELERLGRGPLSAHVQGVIDSLMLAKEQYPGKRNSLDALCDRLEVDNSGRTLHGALLDAELLAEVYIRLTRGQEALYGEQESASTAVANQTSQPTFDLSQLQLPVVQPNTAEWQAHQALLAEVEKASGQAVAWPAVAPMAR